MSEAESEEESGVSGREIWIEKYRPQTLDDIHGQGDTIERLQSYIDRDDLPHLLFAGPAGVGKCVTGETPVLTSGGVEPIGDIVGDADGFADPDPDLDVLTLGDDGEFEYVSPSHVFGKEADNLLTVGTRDGNELTVTPEHRLLVVTADGLEWRVAADLTVGDRIARPLDAPTPDGGDLDWTDAMDGERTLVHLDGAFAAEHGLDESITLAELRTVDCSRSALRRGVDQIQYENVHGHRSRPIDPCWEVTPDLARFVGLAVSEARIDGGRVKFYNTDEHLLDAFEDDVQSLFGLDPERGVQKDVPYVRVGSRTLTHFLESTFDVFRSAAGEDGIGSALVGADDPSRAAFLRAMFDAESHIDDNGIIELAQKNGDHVTLLSYLLATFGIPSRRTTERKAATNGSGIEREYHTLYVSGAANLERFADAIGFSVDHKADRLAVHAGKTSNPNHDTMPSQAALDSVCAALGLPNGDLRRETLDPETPGRTAHRAEIERVLDAATARIEAAQEVLVRLDELSAGVRALSALPATWVEERVELEPIERRRSLAEVTGVRSDRLLEYADGRRTPLANRAADLLVEVDAVAEQPPTERVRDELRTCVDALGVSFEAIAEETSLRGEDVNNLLTKDGDDLATLTRFETVADRLRTLAGEMLSLDVVEDLATLDRVASTEFYFDEVTSVEAAEESRRVYDLSVPESRNYVAGDVPTVMHNTTAATAIAREVYGDDWRGNFLELNASDQRGIDVVRDRIKNFARASFGGFDYRIIFLDEADSLCVPPGTDVVTGYPSNPEVKPIEEVSDDGEPIPSVDFETNEIQSDTGQLVDSGVADFFEVELEDGRTVLASLTHPFFVVDENGRLVETELRDLSPGDEIADFKDEIGVSRCEICDAWTAGRFCSVDCNDEREEFEPAVLSDGGLRTVRTVGISRIEHSHRGKAYNISMEGTPNFMLANGVLTHNTDDAQSALRRTMEQFSDNTRFILSCNYSSRIIDPIQSRCAVFRFSPLDDDAVATQVREIAESEGIDLTDDGLDALVYAAAGDMRRAINALQAAATTGETVDEEAVYLVTSTARPEEIEEMVASAVAGDFATARATLDRLLTDVGMAGGDVIDQLHRSVWEFDLDERATVRLMERMGEADYRITEGASEQVQLEALLAALALDDE